MYYLFVFKWIYESETPCIEGPRAGAEPVDSFERLTKGLFYPQIAHTLCISHTSLLWTAWNERPEFLEICGTLQGIGSQI